MTHELPVVLVIDDQPFKHTLDSSRADLIVKAVHPGDLTETDIIEADLILVDQSLDEWRMDPPPPFACTPVDGVALAGIVRSHLRRLKCPPAALALYSGALKSLAPVAEPREHLIAMAYGLEWAFAKQPIPGMPELNQQVSVLARAVKTLPRTWSERDPDQLGKQLERLLGIDDSPWAPRAFAEIERCRPPMHQLSEWTSGLAVLRWLLHRVMPYPCCILGVPELALRLRVQVEWLRKHLGPEMTLRKALEGARYAGALQGFLGDRWWWAGVEHAQREATNEIATSIDAVHDWLAKRAGDAVAKLDISQPVLTFDSDGNFRSIQPMRECVRIQPDNWPSYADEPWCRTHDAENDPLLRRLVVVMDLDAIDDKTKDNEKVDVRVAGI